MSPTSMANRVRPATDRMSSLRIRLSRCVSTVRRPIPSLAATCLLLSPSATPSRTSRSRSERDSSFRALSDVSASGWSAEVRIAVTLGLV